MSGGGRGPTADVGRIIVGVDGSLASLAAVRYAVAHARRTTGSLHAVLAWTPPGGETRGRSTPPRSLVQVWRQQAADRLRQAFDEALGGVPDDVQVQLHVLRGRPGQVLVEVADRPQDLVVLGAPSAGPRWRHLLRASVASYCAGRLPGTLVLTAAPSFDRPRPQRLGCARWALDQES